MQITHPRFHPACSKPLSPCDIGHEPLCRRKSGTSEGSATGAFSLGPLISDVLRNAACLSSSGKFHYYIIFFRTVNPELSGLSDLAILCGKAFTEWVRGGLCIQGFRLIGPSGSSSSFPRNPHRLPDSFRLDRRGRKGQGVTAHSRRKKYVSAVAAQQGRGQSAKAQEPISVAPAGTTVFFCGHGGQHPSDRKRPGASAL